MHRCATWKTHPFLVCDDEIADLSLKKKGDPFALPCINSRAEYLEVGESCRLFVEGNKDEQGNMAETLRHR
jgi:hypothetical protein